MKKVKLMIFSCMGATMSGAKGHPQKVMKDLGITYKLSTPQSVYDEWWFWLPENLPDELPEFLTVKEVNPMDAIGDGLSKQMADILLAEFKEQEYLKSEREAIKLLPKGLLDDLTPEQYNEVMYALWVRFSNIQHANFLTVEGHLIDTFKEWLISGDDNAW